MAAGFAPVYRETSLDEPDARHIRHLLDMVLKGAEPFPALVVDRHWNVLMTNAGGALMLSAAGGEKGAGETGAGKAGGLNMVDVILAPGPMRDLIVNWDEVVNDLLKRVRREADHAGDETVLNRMLALLPEGWKPPRRDTTDVPLVIPLHLRLPGADGTACGPTLYLHHRPASAPRRISASLNSRSRPSCPRMKPHEAFLKAAAAAKAVRPCRSHGQRPQQDQHQHHMHADHRRPAHEVEHVIGKSRLERPAAKGKPACAEKCVRHGRQGEQPRGDDRRPEQNPLQGGRQQQVASGHRPARSA